MQDDEKAREEQEEAGVQRKRPYQTPTLKRLGKVDQLTQGLQVHARLTLVAFPFRSSGLRGISSLLLRHNRSSRWLDRRRAVGVISPWWS